jgi:hypothetical protein
VLDRAGDFLYHYTPLEKALELILPTRALLLGPFSAMRDPRESHRWGIAATIQEAAPDDDQLFAEVNRAVNVIKQRIRLLSLTRDDLRPRERTFEIFGRGFAHPRLWEHYGNNHRGVCLCLEEEALISVMTGELEGKGHLEHRAVEYKDGQIVSEALHVDLLDVRARGVEAFIAAHVEQHLDELFFKKVCDWQSEMEYRFLLKVDDDADVLVDVSRALKHIVIGANVPDVYLPALAALCEPHGVELWTIQWLNGRPHVLKVREPGAGVALSLDGISFRAADADTSSSDSESRDS